MEKDNRLDDTMAQTGYRESQEIRRLTESLYIFSGDGFCAGSHLKSRAHFTHDLST